MKKQIYKAGLLLAMAFSLPSLADVYSQISEGLEEMKRSQEALSNDYSEALFKQVDGDTFRTAFIDSLVSEKEKRKWRYEGVDLNKLVEEKHAAQSNGKISLRISSQDEMIQQLAALTKQAQEQNRQLSADKAYLANRVAGYEKMFCMTVEYDYNY